MTDDMSRLGEPVGEPAEEGTPVDDVLVRAQEGLAEAEAAGADAARVDAARVDAAGIETASKDASAATSSASAAAADAGDDDAFAARYAGHLGEEPLAEAATSEQAGVMDASAPRVADVAVTASEPAPAEPATIAPGAPAVAGVVAAGAVTQAAAPAGYVTVDTVAAQQPIFVQAPLPPTPRGNRGVGALIGLLAAVSFAALYLIGALAIELLSGAVALDEIGVAAQLQVTSIGFWVTTAVFYLAFLIFVAIANRARWGIYVILGLLVGVASYGGHLVGQLFQAPFWSLTASQGVALMEIEMVSPLAFIAFVAGRELTIWFGAWVAMHGRRATEYNREAMLEYERTLEAGPTLTRV